MRAQVSLRNFDRAWDGEQPCACPSGGERLGNLRKLMRRFDEGFNATSLASMSNAGRVPRFPPPTLRRELGDGKRSGIGLRT